MEPVLIDSNLLLLLIVGSTNRRYIGLHKNLTDYTESDFELLGTASSMFSEIVLLPHVLAELSNLSRQIKTRQDQKFRKNSRLLLRLHPKYLFLAAAPLAAMTFMRLD